MASGLNNHHRDTLRKIFSHPASGNIEWREVVSLLEAVGSVEQRRGDNKLEVTVGPETEFLATPRHKDIDVQMVVDLRRMLKAAGLSPDGDQATQERRT
jgi:hypothetical protein